MIRRFLNLFSRKRRILFGGDTHAIVRRQRLRTEGPGLEIIEDRDGSVVNLDLQTVYEMAKVAIEATSGTPDVFVKITADIDGNGVYTGDVYADGPFEAATETDVNIKLLGFKVPVGASYEQGFYKSQPFVTDVGGSDEVVYAVWRQFPQPPASGTYILLSDSTVVEWRSAFNCFGEGVP